MGEKERSNPIELATIQISAGELTELKNRAGALALRRMADAFEAEGYQHVPVIALRAAASLIEKGGEP